ncbi:transposase [Natrinema gari JCM 14663]|uniref:Transposase n=1 Tax=Natrinema gari JCM 14663 TaxID=1230459 RepID=L9Z6G9_9EURY|nr:transposase [Natrinema gari JCM 14663]
MEIESGYKSIKRFMAATTSKHFGLRFFYFAFACLLYSIGAQLICWYRWR